MMPFVLFVAGLLLIITGVRGTSDKLYSLIASDFIGSSSFFPWVIAIFFIGSVGYVRTLRPLSNIFLVLVIIVLFLSNGGFFAKFIEQTGIGKTNFGGINAGNTGASIGAGLGNFMSQSPFLINAGFPQ